MNSFTSTESLSSTLNGEGRQDSYCNNNINIIRNIDSDHDQSDYDESYDGIESMMTMRTSYVATYGEKDDLF
jgi:hypothetical protein